MFVRAKKIGRYEYLYLAENAREGGRHVQRVIKALGRRCRLPDAAMPLYPTTSFISIGLGQSRRFPCEALPSPADASSS